MYGNTALLLIELCPLILIIFKFLVQVRQNKWWNSFRFCAICFGVFSCNQGKITIFQGTINGLRTLLERSQ